MKFYIIPLLLLLSFNTHALFRIPVLTGPVIDQAGVFTPKQKTTLENYLKKIKGINGPQLQILTIDSLEGEPLESYTIKVVDEWKLGDKERDDGLLIFMAKNDRKVRIEVGDGLEGVMTDYKSAQVIDAMIPFFKKGKYGDGLFYGTTLIGKIIRGESPDLPALKKKKKYEEATPLEIFFGFIFFACFVLFGRGRTGFIRSYSSSGTSWSGGGGSFSGGGSSGSW